MDLGEPTTVEGTGAENGMDDKGHYTEEGVGCSSRERFVLELEFVQCLASPQYIYWLAQNQWFEDPDFIRYLKYLCYWKRPEYAKYLVYPHCLFFLDMLQSRDFRKAMARDDIKEMVHRQQFYFWQFYRENCVKEAAGEDSAMEESHPLPNHMGSQNESEQK